MAKKHAEIWDLTRTMRELKQLGNEQTVNTYRRHGASGDLFGVRIGDLKKILKHVKGQQTLAMELWDTNNSDAMYLAALIADGSAMTQRELDKWARTAWWYMLSEYAVPSVAAEHPKAFAIATKWMNRKANGVVCSGWCTYAAALSVVADDEVPKDQVNELLSKITLDIDEAANRVRYCMNQFVINVGCYYKPLLKQAKATAKKIGKVEVNMGDTACKVPLASEYIAKVETMGRVGKKRDSAKC